MAHWIKWYGPRRGRGSVEDKVSHQPQVKASLATHAASIFADAAFALESRPEVRTGEAQVGLNGPPHGRELDWVVMLNSNNKGTPEDRRAASFSIEKRHGILASAIGRARAGGRGIT